MTTALQVLVTGATGRTGSLVYQKLQQRPQQFTLRGFARKSEKVQQLFGAKDNFFLAISAIQKLS